MGRAEQVGIRLRAWRAIMQTYGAVVPSLDEELRDKAGMDLKTYDALLHTYESGKVGIRMADLAEKVVLTRSGLTTLVDRLEERDLLRRVPDPKDRRATRITLTAHGLKTFRSAASIHVAGIGRHFAGLVNDDEAKVIAEVLERVRRDDGSPNRDP